MPTITLTCGTLEALGVSPEALTYHLTRAETRLLEPLLAGRGFDIMRAISVVVLASGKGFVLSQ
jgi:hypothetical protein